MSEMQAGGSMTAVSIDRPSVRPPSTGERGRRWHVRAISRPATEFTGDFFFTRETPDALWFALGDFAGHGLQATVFMAMIQEVLEGAIESCPSRDPADVVSLADRELRDVFPYNRFATLVLGRALPDGTLQIVNAGHSSPMIERTDGAIVLIGSHGPVVGLAPMPKWRHERLCLRQGDRLVLYTDGVIEAEDAAGVEFGSPRFRSMIGATRVGPLERILDDVQHWSGGERADDQTLFVLTRV